VLADLWLRVASAVTESAWILGRIRNWRKISQVSREDNVKIEGTVVKVHSGGMYQVETDDGRSIRTKLSGRMSRYRIKVLLGDRVTVALSPYDLTHGLIVYRGK